MDPNAGRLSLDVTATNPLPTFSICIPVFNRERVITRALRSCLQQNGNDFEIVVTDDHSSDGTILAIEALQDARIRLVRHRSNQGHGPARNSAIEAALGNWIIELDSDDELLPNGLDHIRAAVQAASPDVDCLEFMYQRDDGCCSPDPPWPMDA
ncbi:MAG: glycosyltransferase family 2 protein [Cyanobium sp.]